MKYAIIKVINSNYFIHAEGITDAAKAKTLFHGVCQTLWSADDVKTASIMIVDEYFNCVEGYKELIVKDESETQEV